ncbi:MAG: PAS domain S-box protein [Nitrospirota bacterium]
MRLPHTPAPATGTPAYRWLPFLIAAMTATVMIVGSLALHYLETRLVTSTGESLTVLAADVADKLDHVLFERYGDAQMMADAFPEKMRNPAALAKYLDGMKERYPLYRWLGVTDAAGRIIAATNPATVGLDRSREAWFRATRDGVGAQLQDVSVSPETGTDRTVGFSAPIRGADGRFLGVVTTRVGLSELEDVFSRTVGTFQAQRGPASRIEWQFLARDGTLVADSLLRQEGKVNLRQLGVPSARLSAEAEPGYVEELHPRRRVQVVTGYAKTAGHREFPGFQWGILVRMDRSDILRPIRDVLFKVGAGGALLFIPMLGLLVWTTTRLRKEWSHSADQLVRLKGLHTVSGALQRETAEVSSDFALTEFLRLLVNIATQVTGARYGAFGLLDETGKSLAQFITVGMDEATEHAIGSWPTGRGLLGFLTQESDVLRLTDLSRHPAFSGFPPHHPPMRSFLGVCVRAHGRILGRLYLADKIGGSEFTDVDEEVIATLAAEAGVAIENGYFLNQIRTAERLYRTTMAALPVSILRLDEQNVVRFANRTFHEMIQRDERDTIGQPIETLLQIESLSELLRSVRTSKAPAVQEREYRLPDAGITSCRLIARSMDATGEIILVIQDITALKQAEQERNRVTRERLLLLESTGEGIFGLDLHARCTFINKAGAAMLGYGPHEAIGKNMHELIHHSRSDGSPYPIEECPILSACRTGQGARRENEVLWRRDGTAFAAQYSVSPIVESGRITGAVVSFADITERLKLEEQLRQAQKMEAIGRLAGGIAHDFNNLVMVINGYSAALLEHLDPNDALRRYPLEIKKAGERAASLTRQLLAFSRRQVLEPRVLSLNDCVVSMGDMLRRLIGEHINLVMALDRSLRCVKADQAQMEQVVMNLVVNARDAMPEGGTLTIETSNVEIDPALARRLGSVQPGPYVKLAVTDTGHGMDAETQARIFEPFFTTKEQGKGTGLGLASVYGIVKQSGGAISVQSAPGQGATFAVYLPRVLEKPPRHEPSEPVGEPATCSETILLVEDEDAVRTLIRETLNRAGYRVLEARDGSEALALGTRHEGPIHLLLTDVVMPRLNGRELADRLTQARPELKVLFMTGYTDDAVIEREGPGWSAHMIRKPFFPRDLARKIREVLDAPPPPESESADEN